MSIFTQVQINKPRHNTFDLSHERKFSGALGALIPCFVAETVPNDTFKITTSQLLRFAPLVAPVMHKFNIYTHFFFVPNRILWDGWEDFINGGVDGETNPPFPVFDAQTLESGGYLTTGNIADYFGVPVTQDFASNPMDISAIPFAAYTRIWYDYYRDQNLQPESGIIEGGLANGDNSPNDNAYMSIRYRAWQHDYFTSALPWTQRGPEATIPLGTSAELSTGLGGGLINDDTVGTDIRRIDGSAFAADDITYPVSAAGTARVIEAGVGFDANLDVTRSTSIDTSTVTVDLSTATAATINDLRRAFRLQEWLELNARGGARYNEMVKIHFGIDPGDSRLQRPEFLGGSRSPIVISEVLQTSGTDSEPTPQGNMAGHGVSINGRNITSYKCREHGFIIGIMSVMPKSAYQQGLQKFWFKFDKFDYFWPKFANIGEQAILNKELYVDTSDGDDDEIFGYTPRYAEYKYIDDSVHGEFRESLDFWHGGRIFANRPLLNSGFIAMTPAELDRIFAVSNLSVSSEQFYVQMHHNVKARRPMPYFGQPTI